MSDICRLCSSVAKHTAFCDAHDRGWANSIEREHIEWTDEASYYAAVDAYVNRQKTLKITLDAETEEDND